MSVASLFRRLFPTKCRTHRNPTPAPRTRLGVNRLEARDCPAYLLAGVLMIDGTDGPDNVLVTPTRPVYWYEVAQVQVVHNGVTQRFNRSAILSSEVHFQGKGGADNFACSAYLYITADGGNGADVLSGGPLDDVLIGGTNSDSIYGNEGNDRVWGGEGLDELRGGYGNDVVYGDGEADTMRGGPGEDILYGGAGSDVMYGDNNAGTAGGVGADFVYGGAGDDFLYGEGGNDYLRGESGTDRLFGDGGHDILYGDNAGNPWGGEATDYLFGGEGYDWIYGEGGDDTLYGEGGNDNLYGGTGADFLNAGSGNDGLFGGIGWADVLLSGPGYDRFLASDYGEQMDVQAESAIDVVLKFQNGGDTEYGGASYTGQDWTDGEIERVDEVLNVLHHATESPRLLVGSFGLGHRFHRHGTTERGYNDGWLHLTDDQFNNGADRLRGYVLHEIGHSYHGNGTYPVGLEGWEAVSGWAAEDPENAVYTFSAGQDPGDGDDDWWYVGNAFASDYARTNPGEDFAESFSAYFTQVAFLYNRDGADWTFYDGAGAAAIPEKMIYFSHWVNSLTY